MAAPDLSPDTLERLLQVILERCAQQLAQRLTELQETQCVGESDRSPWLNAASAATYLDWPLQRLYKLTAQGAIPHYKHDGRLLFNRPELDRWLSQFNQPSDWINRANRGISR